MLQNVIDCLAEDRPALDTPRAQNDQIGLAPARLLDDRPAGMPRAYDALEDAYPVGLGNPACALEQFGGLAEPLVQVGIERQLDRNHDHRQQDDAPGPLVREPRGQLNRLARLRPGHDRHEDRVVSARQTSAEDALVGAALVPTPVHDAEDYVSI